MLMGPVFRAELLRTARQRRYYTLRLAYGLVLLLMVWVGYERMRLAQPVARPSDVAGFAGRTFESFAEVQLITVLLLVPAIFGGAIADEKQRKTLHYLMASRLSSIEIILDKVLGRAAHLAVFVAIGLPVVSLLGLFGGISAESVVVAYLGTFSTAAFAIALTVLISTLARRVRDAILGSYLVMLTWLLVPPLILLFGTTFGAGLYDWIKPVNDRLADTSPIGLWFRSRFWMVLGTRVASMSDQFLWMVESQLVGAVLLLLLAIWRLRPTFRHHEETSARRSWFGAKAGRRSRRWFAHPDCGDDPILWKERFLAPMDPFTRAVLLPAVVFITLPLTMMTELEGRLSRVLHILWWQGYDVRRSLPDSFLWVLQVDLGWYVALWLLAVAGASASSVAIEREKDTWASLTATLLTGREILRGKLLGALWNQRGFAVVLIFLWALGLITGAVHPLCVLLSIALVALMTWFVATVGVYASLRASSTSRAMTSTLAILAFFNGSPLILFFWFIGAMRWESSYSILGAMPWLAAQSMVSSRSLDGVWRTLRAAASVEPILIFLAGTLLSVLCIYAATALALTRRIVDELDGWLDRPSVFPRPATGRVPVRHLEEVSAG